ncbi:hypothetical protein EVAR_49687_1 [Eumeta japonica]|uniref:Secreted protein n=1 Tax=Eumeta variegata TaxID=151549 RepID=A0A4C1WT51_EUMVA|nr:hypothetical protein EVAR_49687_1 [Eumeta japonica]
MLFTHTQFFGRSTLISVSVCIRCLLSLTLFDPSDTKDCGAFKSIRSKRAPSYERRAASSKRLCGGDWRKSDRRLYYMDRAVGNGSRVRASDCTRSRGRRSGAYRFVYLFFVL